MILKTIFEEYKIDNKIFAIGFDNASNNTVVIPHLITLYNLYFGGQFFSSKMCMSCFKFMCSTWISFTTRSYYSYKKCTSLFVDTSTSNEKMGKIL